MKRMAQNNADTFRRKMNGLGTDRRPFLFVIDFLAERPLVYPLDEIDQRQLRFAFPDRRNVEETGVPLPYPLKLNKYPVDFAHYRRAFDTVMRHVHEGDSFLVNLTQPTPVSCNLDLEQLFTYSRARYKLWLRDRFTVFSPETFVRIRDGKIYAYPMKGTIDSSLPDAAGIILSDIKELSEHVTIVDLIRNDLSCFAERVEVKRFRYLEELQTDQGQLLQVSSEICGQLPADFHAHIGDIVAGMLPAGSISGAPKPKTLDIIREAEGYERGYYTGIMGIFDGQALDSAVMIRFVEQQGKQLIYKSGGGITARSKAESEYREMIDKVYVPLA
jgi:para-aminobenzoate synthetase component 1